MTRKDYVKLAEALRLSRPTLWNDIGRAAWRAARDSIADTLQDDNPRFDRERFYNATEAILSRDD